jgi:hypothetical protein
LAPEKAVAESEVEERALEMKVSEAAGQCRPPEEVLALRIRILYA